MMLNSSKKGRSHLDHLQKRHSLSKDEPLTLSVLSKCSGIKLEDLHTIFKSVCDAVPEEAVAEVKTKSASQCNRKPLPMKIEGFSTKNKDLLKELKLVPADVEPLNLSRDQINGYQLCYRWVNQLEKHALGKYKSIPRPRSISNKYIGDNTEWLKLHSK